MAMDEDKMSGIEGGNMAKEFRFPDFTRGEIELRLEKDEFCIYASEKGLIKIIEFCTWLINNSSKTHIHLEDYEILTPNSLRGTIAMFPSR
jgi:hypothetical protein